MKTKSGNNQVRIIGGSWRGRKIELATAAGLRPTPNRVRETLFNWLAPVIHGARCLDLFAGSGALGLEAASRGAAHCVMVEQDPGVCTTLRAQITRLAAEQVELVQADAVRWLERAAQPFDVVFLDPPFQAGLLPVCMERLEAGGWLSAAAWIYLEFAHDQELVLPQHWQWHRMQKAGQVQYGLARRVVDVE